MKILAVAHFTLLRLARTRYISAGAVLVGLVLLLYFGSTTEQGVTVPSDLQWPQNAARILIWLAAVWLGVNLVGEDRADGTLRSTLTRPVSVVEVMAGKVLGGFAAVAILAAAVSLALTAAAMVRGVRFEAAMLMFQMAMLPMHLTFLALAVLLSQVLPRFAAGVLTVFAWDSLFGNRALASLAEWVPDTVFTVVAPVMRLIYWLTPPAGAIYVGYREFSVNPIDPVTHLLAWPYAIHYAGLMCLLAAWRLSRKEL